MDNIINFELLENPINWIIVLLMIAVAGLALSLLFDNTPNASTSTGY